MINIGLITAKQASYAIAWAVYDQSSKKDHFLNLMSKYLHANGLINLGLEKGDKSPYFPKIL